MTIQISEEWRDVVGHEGLYQVSTLGRVKNARRGNVLRVNTSGNSGGYAMVRLYKSGIQKDVQVHNLVLAAFVGPRPEGHEPDHINSVRDDNRLNNLRWLPWLENRARARRNPQRGEVCVTSKLQTQEVLEIRAACASGESRTVIGRRYGVTEACVYLIEKRKNWNHI